MAQPLDPRAAAVALGSAPQGADRNPVDTGPQLGPIDMPAFVSNYRSETQDPDVQALLDELLPLLSNVTDFERTEPLAGQGVGGGNTRNLGGGRYEIRYSAPPNPDPTTDLLAVIVHELTHVAVNESYDSDMLNLPVPQLAGRPAQADPGPNEEAIQGDRLRLVPPEAKNKFMDMVQSQGNALLNDLGSSGLSTQRQAQISEKLQGHTMRNPYHEYDAVLSHLLVWSDQDGVDAPEIRNSDFYRNLTGMAGETAAWRRAGQIPMIPVSVGTQTDPPTDEATQTDSPTDEGIQGDPATDPLTDEETEDGPAADSPTDEERGTDEETGTDEEPGTDEWTEDGPAADSLTDKGTQTDPIPSADAGTQPGELGPPRDASDGDEEPGELGPQEVEPGPGPLRPPTGGLDADDLEPQAVDDQPDLPPEPPEPPETDAPALDSA
jgi:hypothetical protein